MDLVDIAARRAVEDPRLGALRSSEAQRAFALLHLVALVRSPDQSAAAQKEECAGTPTELVGWVAQMNKHAQMFKELFRTDRDEFFPWLAGVVPAASDVVWRELLQQDRPPASEVRDRLKRIRQAIADLIAVLDAEENSVSQLGPVLCLLGSDSFSREVERIVEAIVSPDDPGLAAWRVNSLAHKLNRATWSPEDSTGSKDLQRAMHAHKHTKRSKREDDLVRAVSLTDPIELSLGAQQRRAELFVHGQSYRWPRDPLLAVLKALTSDLSDGAVAEATRAAGLAEVGKSPMQQSVELLYPLNGTTEFHQVKPDKLRGGPAPTDRMLGFVREVLKTCGCEPPADLNEVRKRARR